MSKSKGGKSSTHFRSAVDSNVTEQCAKGHPKTTVKETDRRK